MYRRKWSWWTDSNPRPADYKSAALPTELHQQTRSFLIAPPDGRGDRTRTCGILVPNQALYQTELRPGSWSSRDSFSILSQLVDFVKGFSMKNTSRKMPRICGLYTGAPGGIRTRDLLIRSQTLYPTELRAQTSLDLPQLTTLIILSHLSLIVNLFLKIPKSIKIFFFFRLFL